MAPTQFTTWGFMILVALASAVLLAVPAVAHSIDYVATDIPPQAEFSGQSGHFKVIDPAPAAPSSSCSPSS